MMAGMTTEEYVASRYRGSKAAVMLDLLRRAHLIDDVASPEALETLLSEAYDEGFSEGHAVGANGL